MGTIINEYDKSKSTDYIVDENQHRLETLNSYTQYLSSQ